MFILYAQVTHFALVRVYTGSDYSRTCTRVALLKSANPDERPSFIYIRGAFGKFLAWSFISVTDLQNLSCLVSF